MLIGIDASRAARAQRTGTEGYAAFLIGAMIPLVGERGHRLRLYFNDPPPAGLFPSAPHVEHVVIPFARLWTHVRLGWELRQRPPDVFFTPAHVIPLTYRGPAGATVHDLGYHYFPQAHTRIQRAYLHWSTRHNARRSRRVLADSQATKADLTRFYGVDPDKIRVVYPGVDPALAPVADAHALAAVRARYRLPDDYLLYLGTLQPRKNLVRLVQAYAESGVDAHLVLAGKAGWLADPLLDTISTLQSPLSDHVHLPGYVADADKAALLTGATALVYPSLYEGFGFPVLEAQACATPVLTADNSSLPEVAGGAALLVDAQDTAAIAAGIRRIVNDGNLRAELVERGRVNVGRFTWEHPAGEVLDVLVDPAGASASQL